MNYINKVFIVALLFIGFAANGQELSFKVYGACGMCQERIENNAKNVIGVNTASWDQEENMLTVNYVNGLFQEKELHEQMASIGHDTDKVKSTDEVYNNLHGCCKYRVEENTPEGKPTCRKI